jgi:dihydropteroate synthase
MGVLNVTPDSFSDGGRFIEPAAAIEHARRMIDDGASIIDVGGESTRPGSFPVEPEEQIRRVVPVIKALSELNAIVSIDTTSAAVAQAALDVGASMINDISAGRDDPTMFDVAVRRKVPLVLMHMAGTPRTMQDAPGYENVAAEVKSFLLERANVAVRAGVEPHRVLLDVGIGFGKTLEHNLQVLRLYDQFVGLGYATVLGVSRKRFLGDLTGRADPSDRLMASASAVAAGVLRGADIVRVHDVAPMLDVVHVAAALRNREKTP